MNNDGRILICGGNELNGSVCVNGSKNAILPLLSTTLLAEGTHTFTNVPDISDVGGFLEVLQCYGLKFFWDKSKKKITVINEGVNEEDVPPDIAKKTRVSVIALGPLLSVRGHVKLPYPGGCGIGNRPIDLHLKAMSKMGASIFISNNYIHATCKESRGAVIDFILNTVTGTQNVISAAVLSKGTTTLTNAALEPEIVDQINYLIKMGAKIRGKGSRILVIDGVSKLKASTYRVMPDRVEAATLAIAIAGVGGNVVVKNLDPAYIQSVLLRLEACGVHVERGKDFFKIKSAGQFDASNITTLPYPRFPTDAQAQFMAIMCKAKGVSIIEETIFENRFQQVPELQRMGADITVKGSIAVVRGGKSLSGAEVGSTDIRAAASLIIAGLMAEGETVVNNLHYLDRGYDQLDVKFKSLGADIIRE